MLTKGVLLLASRLRIVMSLLCATSIATICLQAEDGSSKDCGPYIGPTRTVSGKTIGPTSCSILGTSTIRNANGAVYTRIEIGISGSIEGYTPKNDDSRYSGYFTDVPEFGIAQRKEFGPFFHAVGSYYAAKGSGMTLFLPESPKDWNGKMYVTAHGSAQYPAVGEIPPRKPGQNYVLTGRNSYVGLMIDKGYAVAYTRRSGTKFGSGGGSEEVTLDDGTVLGGKAYDYHVGLIPDFTRLAQNLIEARLGRKPVRTYWYGHSAGTALGHLINYLPGANIDANGKRIYDGFLADDAGGGLYLPSLFFTYDAKGSVFSVKPDEKDHLIFDEARRKDFAPQIDIAHQIYAGNDYVLGDYLTNKRTNARLLIEKGLADKTRTYEIVGVSHSDAGRVAPSELTPQNLDLGGVFDALIDILDRWSDRGIEPPPTRSDAFDLGDVDRDGRNENAAIELPEIACPTGVYYEFPEGVKTPGRTGFAPFLREARPALNADTEPIPSAYDKAWLEPLDSRGYVVDMNKNSVRDTRDSITQAWRRRTAAGKKYGTLGFSETLTHARYVGCVAASATELLRQNLLSENAVEDYIRKAIESDIGVSVSEPGQSTSAPEVKKVGTKK